MKLSCLQGMLNVKFLVKQVLLLRALTVIFKQRVALGLLALHRLTKTLILMFYEAKTLMLVYISNSLNLFKVLILFYFNYTDSS